MDIFELAAQLGDTLKQDARLIALDEARKSYQADRQVQALVVEYEVQRKALEQQMTEEEKDTRLIDMIQERINELYSQIATNDAYLALAAAQSEVNELMNAVNQTISQHIAGATGGCTHDCSTCGGCH